MRPQDPDQETFNQFCHLSARRTQFAVRVVHRMLTGQPMADEPAGATPLQDVVWIEMRMAEIYRQSPPDLQQKLAAAEARFRDWPIEKAEALLSTFVELLNEFDAKRKVGPG